MNTKKTSYLLAGIIIITLIVMNACNSNDNNQANMSIEEPATTPVVVEEVVTPLEEPASPVEVEVKVEEVEEVEEVVVPTPETTPEPEVPTEEPIVPTEPVVPSEDIE